MNDMVTNGAIAALHSYVIENIWNEPHKESRTNIKPVKVYTESRINAMFINDTQVQLPTNEPYFIMYINKGDLPGPAIADGWTSGTELIIKYRRIVEIFSEKGCMFPKNSFYLLFDLTIDTIIIAVKKSMFIQLGVIGQDTYVSTWSDSTIEDNYTVTSSRISNEIDQSNMFDLSYDGTLYVNGRISSPIAPAQIPIGSYVEHVKDDDVKIKFRIDLDDPYENRMYLDASGVQRQIIHTPKALNPDGLILTLNTVKVYARKKIGDLSGILVSDATYNHNFSQITHADFGIPRYIIEDAQSILGVDNIYLEVHISMYGNDNVVTQDNNYINQLYGLSDVEIVRILSGEEATLPFWSAEVLQETPYLKAFYEVEENPSWGYFTSILGCYYATSLLSKVMFSFDLGDVATDVITISKDYIASDSSQVILFEDGLKISDEYFISNDLGNAVSFEFNSAFTPKNDSAYNGRIIERIQTDKFHKYTSTSGDEELTFNFKPMVYLQGEFTAIKLSDMLMEDRSIYWQSLTQTNVYNSSVDNNDGTWTLAFTPLAIDRTFIIAEDLPENLITPTYHKYDLSELKTNNKPFVFDLICKDINDVDVPILKLNSLLIYLNGKKLTMGIDYKIATIAYDERIVAHQICITSLSYIRRVGSNACEVYTNNEYELFNHLGFAAYTDLGVLPMKGSYFKDLSELTVLGRLITNPRVVADSLHVDDPTYMACSPYSINTRIPEAANKSIEGYLKIAQNKKIATIQDYVSNLDTHQLGAFVTPPFFYRLYSIYTQVLCKDILLGKITAIPNDPDGIDDTATFSKYQLLKEHDIVYGTDVNWDYIDADVMHSDVVTSPSKYAMINTIRGLLPKDNIKDDN